MYGIWRMHLLALHFIVIATGVAPRKMYRHKMQVGLRSNRVNPQKGFNIFSRERHRLGMRAQLQILVSWSELPPSVSQFATDTADNPTPAPTSAHGDTARPKKNTLMQVSTLLVSFCVRTLNSLGRSLIESLKTTTASVKTRMGATLRASQQGGEPDKELRLITVAPYIHVDQKATCMSMSTMEVEHAQLLKHQLSLVDLTTSLCLWLGLTLTRSAR